jgi:DNA invertase Pin-like site-specific DNA recombinase
LQAVVGYRRRRHLHDATQKVGRPLYWKRSAWRRRFQYAIAKMATQRTALIAKRAASLRSERLMIATMGQASWAFLSAFAQDERERIVRRAQDGRKAARARGVQFGRKPKLTQHQQAEGRRRPENGESARSIARDFNCHHAIVARLRARPRPPV